MSEQSERVREVGRIALEQAVDAIVEAARPAFLKADKVVVPRHLVELLRNIRTGQRLLGR
jgi:hypothetical protein